MSLSAFPEKANKKEVFIINLADASPSVEVLKGKDAGFGQALEAAVNSLCLGDGPYRLHDWGGVISNAEESERTKLRQQEGADIVFSFTPWNAKGKEKIPGMMDFARSAGFVAMVIMTQKEGQAGKADTFSHFRSVREDVPITYYEDTYDVIKQCTKGNTTCYHVFSPEFPVAESEKLPEILDGTVDGYLEIWEPPSGGNASTTVSIPLQSKPQKDQSPTGVTRVAPMSPSELNEYLRCNSYLGSKACATLGDYKQYEALSSLPANAEQYPHLERWRSHIGQLMTKFGIFDFRGNPLSS